MMSYHQLKYSMLRIKHKVCQH